MEVWQLICLVLLAAAFYQAGIVRLEKRGTAVRGTICVSPLSPGRPYRRGQLKKGH